MGGVEKHQVQKVGDGGHGFFFTNAASHAHKRQKRQRCSALPAATMRARSLVFAPSAVRRWWVISQARQEGAESAC